MSRVAAVILSAGLSSRMGRFKPLLPLGGKTVLERCIDCFHGAGVEEVVVVTGKRGGEVAEVAGQAGATAVHNPQYRQGMFSSVLAGVRALPQSTNGFFVLPVDMPLVRPETVARLLKAFQEDPLRIVYPVFDSQRGHPPLVHIALAGEILEHDGEGGLRTVLGRHESEAMELPVADCGVIHDLDHPDDYELAQSLAKSAGPTEAECAELWKLCGTSAVTVAHCRAVATVAGEFCRRLNDRGDALKLDPVLTLGAALVHDLAKGVKRHDQAGAAILREHGFHEAADIVAVHSDLALSLKSPITERDVVFLADKVVRGDGPVALRERYRHKLELFGHEPDVRQAIEDRLARAEAVRTRFAQEMNASPEAIAAEVLA